MLTDDEPLHRECRECDGTGRGADNQPCDACDGEGEL